MEPLDTVSNFNSIHSSIYRPDTEVVVQVYGSSYFYMLLLSKSCAIVMKVTADRLYHLLFQAVFFHNLYSKEIV